MECDLCLLAPRGSEVLISLRSLQYPHEVSGTPVYLYEVATESVCESAARLLFMSIKWAKSVPAFSTLPLSDQVHVQRGRGAQQDRPPERGGVKGK